MPRCTEHHGRHGLSDGRCVLVGSEVPRPFVFRDGGHCGVCGVALDVRFTRGQRERTVLLAGTDTPHGHSQPAVSLDADELAAAIVRASRATRQELQPQQPPQASREQEPAMPRQANGRPALGGIPEFSE